MRAQIFIRIRYRDWYILRLPRAKILLTYVKRPVTCVKLMGIQLQRLAMNVHVLSTLD